MTPKLTPVMTDAADIRERLYRKTVAELHKVFPLDLKGRTLELADVRVHDQEFSPDHQRKVMMDGGSLHVPVSGTLRLKDGNGKLIDEAKNFRLLHLPYLNERHTVLMDGNEYQIANMLRRKPGVYTERSENGDLSTFYNLSKGRNFSLLMHPEKGTLYMNYGTSNLPLYPILKAMGAPHTMIAHHLGEGVANENAAHYAHKEEAVVGKLWDKLSMPGMVRPETHEARVADVNKRLAAGMLGDGTVAERTLGHAHDKVTPLALLHGARRLIDTFNGKKDVDDADSLAFKTFHSVDDFIPERVRLTARTWAPKVRFAFQGKDVIRGTLKPAPFSDSVKKWITTSPLTAVPTGINPIELMDHAVKVTSLGEGGIPSERAIPYDARMTHASHYGSLDPIRTPESGHAGVDIRASIGALRDDHGNLYTQVRDVKTGKPVALKAGDLQSHVIAFPYQELKGMVDAMDHGETKKVPAARVKYQFIHEAHTLSPATALLPMLRNIQGNRAVMGSKMQTQALPLVHPEAPWVQVKSHLPSGESFERVFGKMIVPTAPVSGVVTKIEDGWIHIQPHDKTAHVKVADRPTVAKKKFGGKRFVIELKKGTKPFGKVFLNDYGYLPGFTGPDGDSLDFWVGDDENGALAAVDTYEPNAKGKIELQDVKYMVGIPEADIPKQVAQIEQKPGVTTKNLRYFKDWAELDESIAEYESRSKAAEDFEKDAAEDDGSVHVPFQTDFPMPSKTFLHHDLHVKVGDNVTAGQSLGESNYTAKGVLALGKNLRVGYLPYYGLNSNDAVVISQGAADKLTSVHMYREIYTKPAAVELSKGKHKAYFGPKHPTDFYKNLDDEGVVKKGTKVHVHDPLVVGAVKVVVTGANALLGKISKALTTPYREVNLTWEHGYMGVVTEVVKTPHQITILVKTLETMQVGDKLAGRWGNKGVVSRIVPDHEMLQDEAGKPIEVLMTSAGIVSRINPGQTLETAVGKVAEKTGKPIIFDNTSDVNTVKWAKDLLKKHGLKDKEMVYDPMTGRTLKGSDGKGVMVGRQFITKLFKSTHTNFSGHSVGPYDINEQPLKVGGEESAKSIGKMEFDALVAHNARHILKEVTTIRGQKNDEYWRAVQLGAPVPASRPSFAFTKFTAMLEGAGVKVQKTGSKIGLLPLTDRDILDRSSGAITSPKTLAAKDLKPESNGLFDMKKTGGPGGMLYSHIPLHEPMPNPVFEEPIRRLLGMTQAQFSASLRKNGGQWFRDELKHINVEGKIAELRASLKRVNGAELNNVVKQIKFLEALQTHKLRPEDAYVLSNVPVIPPVFRPITPMPNDPSQLMVADANRLYGHMMDSNRVLKETVLPSDLPGHRENLYKSVGAVFGTSEVEDEELRGQAVKGFLSSIAGTSSPKSGFFHRKVINKTQDVSGRGTAVPDVNLGLDQIGLPEQMLWQMFDKLLVARLVRQGNSPLDARRMVDSKAPSARAALEAERKERPVFYNRAPTLHRFSVVGAYAQPVQGKTIRVSPFAEKGLNLDYDGDTLQIHAPVTPGGIQDVKKMMLSTMLLSDQGRDKLMVFPQHEAIMGLTHASKFDTLGAGPVHTFKTHDEIMHAYRSGKISAHDTIHLKP